MHTHYIHVEPIGGRLWRNHILFRDYLIKHPKFIIEYSDLKRCLEKDFFQDRNKYAVEKNPFLKELLKWQKEKNILHSMHLMDDMD